MRDKAYASGCSIQSPTSTILNPSMMEADREHGSGHDRGLDPDIPQFIVIPRSPRAQGNVEKHDHQSTQPDEYYVPMLTVNDSAPRLPHRRSSAKSAIPKIAPKHLQELEDLFDGCDNDLMPLKPTRVRSVGVTETCHDATAPVEEPTTFPNSQSRHVSRAQSRKSFRYPSIVLSPTQETAHDDSMSPSPINRGLRHEKPDLALFLSSPPLVDDLEEAQLEEVLHHGSSLQVLMSSKPYLIDQGDDDDDELGNDHAIHCRGEIQHDTDDDDSFLLPFMSDDYWNSATNVGPQVSPSSRRRPSHSNVDQSRNTSKDSGFRISSDRRHQSASAIMASDENQLDDLLPRGSHRSTPRSMHSSKSLLSQAASIASSSAPALKAVLAPCA